MPRKIIHSQKKFRSTEFKVDQYWQLSYTERYPNGLEKDFKTIIKARSYSFAKHILNLRLKEGDTFIETKSVQGFMFHKNYTLSPHRKPLGLKEWGEIRASCFPNENNHLFKIETPRPSWKSNRFNGSGKNNMEHIKKHGFKKGKKNWASINVKGKILSKEERSHKLFLGKWVEWDEDARNQKKIEIIEALEKANNVRVEASKLLGIDRNTLYLLFKKFPEIDWKKDYPAPPPRRPPLPSKEEMIIRGKKAWATMNKKGTVPFGGKSHTPETQAKRVESLKKGNKKRRDLQLKTLEPKIRKALTEGKNCRKKAAQIMGFKESTFAKYLHIIKKEMGINWSKEYPNRNSNKKYIK